MENGKPKWRFFVDCVACEKPIILCDAPSPDENAHPTHRGVEIACPHCRTRHTYHGAEVQRGLIEGADE
jgi:hypothetical protein